MKLSLVDPHLLEVLDLWTFASGTIVLVLAAQPLPLAEAGRFPCLAKLFFRSPLRGLRFTRGTSFVEDPIQGAAADASNVVKTFSSQHGTFVVKESLLAGPGGFVKFESTWQSIDEKDLRLITVIPSGGRRR